MRLGSFVLVVYVLLAGCATTDLPPVSKDFIFEDDERRLWIRAEEEEKRLNRSGLIYEDLRLETYLNEIARQLQPPEIYRHIPFEIKVIKNPYLNAFAYPNGKIYIHTGILARMENEAQLATVLAHEMAHPAHRHVVKRFRDIQNKAAFASTVGMTLGGIGSALGALGSTLSVYGYSRELETEADMEGLRSLLNAGYDGQEAINIFRLLLAEKVDEDKPEPFLFGNHPMLQDRINNHESFLAEQKRPQKEPRKNTEIFIEKVHQVMIDNAELDLRTGRFKKALQAINRYQTIKPDSPRACYLLGEIFRQQGGAEDIEKAKVYFERAVMIEPTYAEPYRGLGIVYFKEGEKETARGYLAQYIHLNPKATDIGHVKQTLKECGDGGE